MKQIYLLSGLNCPNCSAKIEREVGALDGVESACVDLMHQTLTIRIDKQKEAYIRAQILSIVHSHEPDVIVSEQPTHPPAHAQALIGADEKRLILRLALGALLFFCGIAFLAFTTFSDAVSIGCLLIAYLLLGGDVVWRAVTNITKGKLFDEHFLMSVSTVGAFIIGEYPEAVAVMLFYQISEFFQSLAVKRSRRSISELMDIRPGQATVHRDGEWITVAPEEVAIDEWILVKPGERIPLDGIVTEGESYLDTVALTGESVPRRVHAGDEVLSGCINTQGLLTISVTKTFPESTASKILDLVENASSRKAPTERFITTFARWYTPIVVSLAAALALLPPLLLGDPFSEWIHRGFVFLVVSCPCALVISVPLTFFGGIGAASKHGILIKGSHYLEALSAVRTVVFDKTGTLTKGVFEVTALLPATGYSESTLLAYAAKAEQFSMHPIARSILDAYATDVDSEDISDCKEIPGYGVRTTVNDTEILVGNAKWMDAEHISYPDCNAVGTKVYVAVNGDYVGCIVICDTLKPDSHHAVTALRKVGVESLIMLTGDEEAIGHTVTEELGLDACYARLLPAQKVEILEQLDRRKKSGTKLAFVGDGINDAPVLARADVGISMGALGSDAAMEAADVVLMTDEPSKLAQAMTLAKITKRIVIQNIVFALGIKILVLLLGAFGITGMWEAVFADVGVALLAVGNAMRILKNNIQNNKKLRSNA